MTISIADSLRETVLGLAEDYRETKQPALVEVVPQVVNGTLAAQWAKRNDDGIFYDTRKPAVPASQSADFPLRSLGYTAAAAALIRKVGGAYPVPNRVEDALAEAGVDAIADATLSAQNDIWGQMRADIETALTDGSTGLAATSAGSGTLALTAAGSVTTTNVIDFFNTLALELLAKGVRPEECDVVLPIKAIQYLMLADQIQSGTAIAIGANPTTVARRTGSIAPAAVDEFFKTRFKFRNVLAEEFAQIGTSGTNELAGSTVGYVMRSSNSMTSAAITIYQPAPGGEGVGLAGNAGAVALYVRATAGKEAPGFIVASDAQYTVQVRNRYAGRRFAITYA